MDGVVDSIPKVGTASTSTALQRAFIRTLLLAQTPEGYIANCKAITSASVPDYPSIKTPLLLVAGAEDYVSPMELSRKIFDKYVVLHIPSYLEQLAYLSQSWGSADKHLQVLDKTGHWYCIESPEAVGDAIVEFTGKIKAI